MVIIGIIENLLFSELCFCDGIDGIGVNVCVQLFGSRVRTLFGKRHRVLNLFTHFVVDLFECVVVD